MTRRAKIFFTIAAIILLNMISMPSWADHQCELEYLSGDGGNYDPCVVVTNSNIWETSKLRNYYTACTLDFILDEINRKSSICRVGGSNGDHVVLFQPKNVPDHSITASEVESGTAMLDRAITITRNTLLLGWKVLWDDGESEPCLGDPNDNGTCHSGAVNYAHGIGIFPQDLMRDMIASESDRTQHHWEDHKGTIVPPFDGACYEIDPEDTDLTDLYCTEEPYKSHLQVQAKECEEVTDEICILPAFNVHNDARFELRDMEIDITSAQGSLVSLYGKSNLVIMRNHITASSNHFLFIGRSTKIYGQIPGAQSKSTALTNLNPNRINGKIGANVFQFTDVCPDEFNPTEYFGPNRLNVRFENAFETEGTPYRFSDTLAAVLRCKSYADGFCALDQTDLMEEDASRLLFLAATRRSNKGENTITLPLYRVDHDGSIVAIEGEYRQERFIIPFDPSTDIAFTLGGRRILMPTEANAPEETDEPDEEIVPENAHCWMLPIGTESLLAYCDETASTLIGNEKVALWTHLAYGSEEMATIEHTGDLYQLTLHEGITTKKGQNAVKLLLDDEGSVTLKTWAGHLFTIEHHDSDTIYCSYQAETCATADTICTIGCTRSPLGTSASSTNVGLIDTASNIVQDFSVSRYSLTSGIPWVTVSGGGLMLEGEHDEIEGGKTYITTRGEMLEFRSCPAHSIADDDGSCKAAKGYVQEEDGSIHARCPNKTIWSPDTNACVCPDADDELIWDGDKPLCLTPCDTDEIRVGHSCRAIPDPGDDDDDDDDDVTGDDDDDDDDDAIKEIGDDDDSGCSAMDRMMGRCDDEVEVDSIGTSDNTVIPSGTVGGGCSLTPAHATAWPTILFGISLLPIALVRRRRRR